MRYMRCRFIDVDERGSVIVFSAIIMVVLAAIATLAVDYGFLQYKKTKLQISADAAALAGAADAVVYGNALDLIKQRSVAVGQENLTSDDMPSQALNLDDIAISKVDNASGNSLSDTVSVVVSRASDRNNPVDMFLGNVMGWKTQDLNAKSSAAAYCSNQTKCLKPWSPPSSMLGKVGDTIVLMLSKNKENEFVPGNFQAVDYPPLGSGDSPVTGADMYEENIVGCTGSNGMAAVKIGDLLQLESGVMAGKTHAGYEQLYDSDPNASWNSSTMSIVNSKYSDPMNSPRVVMIPFYDEVSDKSVKVAKIAAVFITDVKTTGNNKHVSGIFIRGMAVEPNRSSQCDTGAPGVFGVSLVK